MLTRSRSGNEISKADWNKLWGFYLGAKRYLIEHADPDQIDAHFLPDVLAGDGSMVGYYEILPYAKLIRSRPQRMSTRKSDDIFSQPVCLRV
jgi:hypothetical protein